MKLFKLLIKKIFLVYLESIKSLHIIILIFSSLLSIVFIKNNILVNNNVYMDITNGMGILTSFFILVMDKINIKELKNKLETEIPILNGTHYIKIGEWISNTLFSLIINMFLLLGSIYILLFFKIESVFLILWLISTIFIGFLFSLIVWSYLE